MLRTERTTSSQRPTRSSAVDTRLESLRERCVGLPPLHARLEPWMVAVCQSDSIHELVYQHGSPLNVICGDPMTRNIGELNAAAERRGVKLRAYFARKANKCLSFVDAALSVGAGVDVASLQELEQVIALDGAGPGIICTAAVKDQSLMQACVAHGVTIVIDNEDELVLLSSLVTAASKPASVAIRLSGFSHDNTPLHSRFGFDVTQIDDLLRDHSQELGSPYITVEGLHFHLDGYAADERVSAITECLPLVERFRSLGHPVSFLDVGGGIPMSYLEHAPQWNEFWKRHEDALLEKNEPLTYRNHALGLTAINGQIYGKPNCYPFYQTPVRAEWLSSVLDARYGDSSLATAIRRLNLQLRCEPGRSILDGCGLTIAKVVFRKQHRNGDWFIGLSMNRTQCRTSSDDFLVDPLLIPQGGGSREAIEGFLVGAYCTESELLSLRKLRFPSGVCVGDLVAFPNTAGYFMHFLESRSHQFPLAKNVVYCGNSNSPFDLDDIDLT